MKKEDFAWPPPPQHKDRHSVVQSTAAPARQPFLATRVFNPSALRACGARRAEHSQQRSPQPTPGCKMRLDCTQLVSEPVDASPMRSPQAVHSVLAERFRGRALVEIGTHAGDGLACFSSVTSSSVGVEMSRRDCAKLEKRAQQLASRRGMSFGVFCRAYQCGVPDADVYTWWQACC